GWGYFSSSTAGYLISTQVAVSAGDELMLKLANGNTTTDSKYRVYFANSATATQWSGWTLIDSVEVPAGTSTWDYYTVDLGFTAADTGYIGITYSGASYYYVIDDVVLPPQVIEEEEEVEIPEGYTLQGFEDSTFPPEDWQAISNNTSNSVTRSSAAANSGTYSARFSSYSSASDYTQYLITRQFTPSSGDSLTFWYRKSNSSTETFSVGVSTTNSDVTSFTFGSAITNASNTTWQKHKEDLSAHQGTPVYVALKYYSSYMYYLYIDDFMYPWVPSQTPELTVDASLNFYGVAVDTAAGTGSHSLTTTVSNTGSDTLTGTIASRSTDFTVSPATIDLLPDSSMTLTVTYAPADAEFDTSYIDFTTNTGGATGAADSLKVFGYAFVADAYDHFEFADYDSSGFVRYNTAGGVYWTDNSSSSAINGSNSVTASSHKYGGDTWLLTPAYTIDADGERLTWHMKTGDATPTTTSKLYIELLTGNTYADLANAVTLDSFVVSPTAS
ncbi:MAG: choice-of-anchor J domain-containing protein, partial [Arenicellales bacterium]|nr:choice-of-anchor J domain-containing protein [Arenicellales bacterium]